MPYTLKQAAEATGKSKPTILRAIQSHKISAARDELTQGWLIEPAELHRVYPPVTDETVRNGQMTHGVTGDATVSIRELQAKLDAATSRLADKDEVIDDLRRRLDASDEERRKTQAQLTSLLTDQRVAAQLEPMPRRSWWRWGKR
jgi:excisionase family DNA binding protein